MGSDEIQVKIAKVLLKIIEENVDNFKKEGDFKVHPGYGYDKFYLDRIEGSYDMSLQSLIHYIMYEDGFYKSILTEQEYAAMENVIENYPDAIYSPQEPDEDYDDYDEDYDYEESQQQLDEIYYDAIVLVGNKLSELGFDVGETFSEYL